jgi:hypothetical protein
MSGHHGTTTGAITVIGPKTLQTKTMESDISIWAGELSIWRPQQTFAS